jgi:hypothetical protein
MAPGDQSQTHSSGLELKELDLIKLENWQGVGLQLGIEDYELQKIRLNYQEHETEREKCSVCGFVHVQTQIITILSKL